MPIKGLTNRGAKFPQIGVIRKGAKMPEGGKKPGKDLTYFRIEFEKGEPPATAERCEALFGKEPQELKIMLPLNRIESVWSAWIDAYTAGGLVYRSNGNGPDEIKQGQPGVIFWRDPMTGMTLVRNGLALKDLTLPDGTEIKQGEAVPCVASMGHPVGEYETGNGQTRKLEAAPTAQLMVMLQGLGRFAYLAFKTTSQHDISNIDAQLEGLEAVQRAATAAGLSGVPLVMRRRPKMVSTPIKEGDRVRRQRMEKWLVSLETDPEWASVKMHAMIEAATPEILEGHFVERLPAPGETGGDEWDAAAVGTEPAEDLDAAVAAQVAAGEAAAVDGAIMAQVAPAPGEPEPAAPPASEPATPAKAPAKARERQFDTDLLDTLIKESLAGTRIEAATMLGRSPWRLAATPMRQSHVVVWARAYKAALAENLDPGAAADAATAELAELAGG